MAKARALDKRRKSIRNIRKITRTMELIATARFKKAMDRAHAATAYTKRITQLVADLAQSGLAVSHPLLEGRSTTEHATLLVLTANRGLCGGYNGGVVRLALPRITELRTAAYDRMLEAVAALPGVDGVSFTSVLPLKGEDWTDLVSVEGDTRPVFERPIVNYRSVAPDFFNAVSQGVFVAASSVDFDVFSITMTKTFVKSGMPEAARHTGKPLAVPHV